MAPLLLGHITLETRSDSGCLAIQNGGAVFPESSSNTLLDAKTALYAPPSIPSFGDYASTGTYSSPGLTIVFSIQSLRCLTERVDGQDPKLAVFPLSQP
jgi:hypothetical protein